MTDLFQMGGPLFMGFLTIILSVIITVAIICFLQIQRNNTRKFPVSLIKEIGIFGLVIGVLGQFVGLYSAFEIIEQAGSIAPGVLASGLKISSIPTMYGILVCLVGYVLYLSLMTYKNKSEAEIS